MTSFNAHSVFTDVIPFDCLSILVKCYSLDLLYAPPQDPCFKYLGAILDCY